MMDRALDIRYSNAEGERMVVGDVYADTSIVQARQLKVYVLRSQRRAKAHGRSGEQGSD
jgi:hypothetical protein